MAIRNDDVIDSRFLQTCDIPVEDFRVEPFTMVIFGGAGDLSKRKLLPAVFHLFQEKELSKGFSIVGFDRIEMSDDQYREMMKGAVQEFSDGSFDENSWSEFSKRLFYLSGSFEDDENFKKLIKKIIGITVAAESGKKEIIYYMAVPPQVMPLAVDKLKHHNLCKGRFSTKVIHSTRARYSASITT
jgi:glucose-6-phosphate 1-dehydrogenase